MSANSKRAFGPLFAPKYDRPWLRYIVDGGEGVVAESEEGPKPEADAAKTTETDWKAEARKWESRAKENFSATEELQKLKDAEKTDLQRATDAAAAAQSELASAKAEAARLRIAAAHGIGGDHLDLLTGDTDEELEAKAKKLAALITKPEPVEPERKGAWAPFDPDEGKSPSGVAQAPLPGVPRLAAAFDAAISNN